MSASSSNLRLINLFIVLLISLNFLLAQDTFSIVAVDPETGEVGSAGASCVNLNNFPNLATGFLGELFPGVGAINTQAAYNATNQANAKNRMNEGNTPEEIIEWLLNNDIQNQPQQRQYGIVALIDGLSQSAAHTGSSNFDYKNHITGPNYSIQGNILLGQEILDSMEANFLNTEGDLSCKLMAAMQGANVIGADNRCTNNGTSSLFAFLKVAQPSDTFGNPSLSIGVRYQEGQGIEPIDKLQEELDEIQNCTLSSINQSEIDDIFKIFPLPSKNLINIHTYKKDNYSYQILNLQGSIMLTGKMNANETSIDISHFDSGSYLLLIQNEKESYSKIISKI